jgi:spore maturation protein CgeB
MKLALFYHSIRSDWNNGNAHFLRGVVTELQERGHAVTVFEPCNGWSRENLIAGFGNTPLNEFETIFPEIDIIPYEPDIPHLEELLDGMDLVIVHEWNDTDLIRRIGRLRAGGARFRLLFHDTHHRCFYAPQVLKAMALGNYDGVLAFGQVLRDFYLSTDEVQNAWTWHEAADTRIFKPRKAERRSGDLVWIGNWGDDERKEEIGHYLLEPSHALGLQTTIFGVRYPQPALDALAAASVRYGGWLPNYRVPEIFGTFRMTVHIPRRPYLSELKGIPTIRPFEALACGIPLICSLWEDTENLFTAGKDYLLARTPSEMKTHMRAIISEAGLAESFAQHGRATLLARHTCAHRVDELMSICAVLGMSPDTGSTGLDMVGNA